MTVEGNGSSYAVHMSKQTSVHLKHLHSEASKAGKGSQFLNAFRQILERLRNDPWGLGEPLYVLAALNLQVRKAVIAPLVVDFAIHTEKPLVFIRGFKVLS